MADIPKGGTLKRRSPPLGIAHMTAINPFAAPLAQSSHVQHQQSAEKSKHIRRTQELSKDVALRDDQLEHQVESSEELAPIHDEDQEHPSQKRRRKRAGIYNPNAQDVSDGEEPETHLDLTA